MDTKQYAAAGPWISVEEALPEEDTMLLIRTMCSADMQWAAGFRHGDNWYEACGYAMYLDGVQPTHWAEVRV